MGDTLTGRALKRVRFAENQDNNNAEVPAPTSESAPSNLPAEAASSSSVLALPAFVTEVPDQVMSEGANSSSDAAVRLSMQRTIDNPNSESEAKRHHTGHSMLRVVMLLDDSDVSHAIGRCREVCRRRGAFHLSMSMIGIVNLGTIRVLVAQMVQLLFAPVCCRETNVK